MQAYKLFKKEFSKANLKQIYIKKIMHNSSPGVDRINRRTFDKDLDFHIETIVRKVNNNTYKFSKYREKLITKGKNRKPRVISIPTIRDKIVLRALCNILLKILHDETLSKLPQTTIYEVKKGIESGQFDFFTKVDIKNYYPSIKHDILLKKIRRKIRKKELINLIEKALTQSTQDLNQQLNTPEPQGVPQGLSISNILASLYLYSLDQKQLISGNYSYFRYVDDILILSSSKDHKVLEGELTKQLQLIGLNTHCDSLENCEKQDSGPLSNSFTYLGYQFNNKQISVKSRSIDNIKTSIMKLFADNKYSKKSTLKVLEWKLNLRITGCMFENKKYGWVFYFSQLTDLSILFELDFLVKKLAERYKINLSKMRIKKFIRTYCEITKNLNSTSYIPNFSEFDVLSKGLILQNILNLRITNLNESEIEIKFKKLIKSSIRELDKDVQDLS